MTPDRILTTAEAAEILRVSETHLKSEARKGKLPGRKTGKLWRFSHEALMAWVRGGQDGRKTAK